MATVYILTTNGVELARFTSKARAVSEAEKISGVADKRGAGDVVEVTTVKTSKVVFSHTATTLPAPVSKSVTMQGTEDVPACVLLAADEQEARQTGVSTGYVGVMQQVPGFNAMEHVHAAGCRDITREMRKFGQSEDDTFPYPADSTVWDVITNNDGGRASDCYTENTREHAQEMIFNASGEIRIMPCAESMPLGTTPFGEMIDAGGQYIISEEVVGTVIPDGAVTSALVDSHSPNGVEWPVETRTLSPWYWAKGESAEDTMTALRKLSQSWDMNAYSLPNGDMALTLNTDESITSVFYVEIPKDEGFMFHCNNCGQNLSDEFPNEDQHSASCLICGSDGHAECQHFDPVPLADWEIAALNGTDNAFDAAFGSDHTSGNADMVDTMDAAYTVSANLSIMLDNGPLNIGWHEFTITADMTEFDIPDMYGERHGSGNPKDGWSSVITVLESYAV